MLVAVNLKEYIHPKMDLLFLALNAPEVSNKNAHWFSRNLSFWNLLFKSSIISQPIVDPLKGDETIFGNNIYNFNHWIIGVTDLNRDIVETRSSLVSIDKWEVERILNLLDNTKTSRLCLMHYRVAEEFEKHNIIKRNFHLRTNQYGKVGQYKSTEIFEVPFHNASISINDKIKYYHHLKGNICTEPTHLVLTNKESKNRDFENKVITAKNNSVFYLPDNGNTITEKDIKKGVLRITTIASSNFPSKSTDVAIIISNEKKIISYEKRTGRSDLLKIGKDFMNKLDIKPFGKLKFTKFKNWQYIIEKA